MISIANSGEYCNDSFTRLLDGKEGAMVTPQEVNEFWIKEVGPKGWYRQDEAIDQRIRERFRPAWEEAAEGGLKDWKLTPEGLLAYLILLDQFPRNMFRGDDPRAFATDKRARACAKQGIKRGWDMRVPEPERQFYYLPLMHSECLTDQDRCVRLMLTHMPETGADNLRHAKAHREVIRRFGRFPYRNAALSRRNTQAEQAFIEDGGYASVLRAMPA